MASVAKDVHRKHKSLVIKLCDKMDPNSQTYKTFIFHLESKIFGESLSRIQQIPRAVFGMMEEKGVLKVGKYHVLEKALIASGYTDVLSVLKNEKENILRQMRKRSYDDVSMGGGPSNIGKIICVRKEREDQGLSDAELLESSHEGAVTNDGASTTGLQESVDGSNTGNQVQSQDLQESGTHRTTEADDNSAFSTTKRAEVLLPNNPRGGRIMVLTVKEMECNIGEKIGEGGFGTIYKAKRNDFEFAIKKIIFESELKRKAYEKEIHSGRILHPFINPIIAYAEKPPDKSEKGLLYLMYPYMQNKDLRHNIDLVMQGNKLSNEDSNSRIWVRCIYQIVHAVDYLHTPVMSDRPRGAIFHRDLTSQNILLDQNFNAKIGDFGISLEAKVNAKQATVTRAIGTQGYHPPNMIGSQYFPSYDVFSIGVVMLEILTGEKAVLEEDCEFLHAKYRLQRHKLIYRLDQLTEEIENNAAKWTNEGHRNKLAELALKAVSLDESERKITDLLQELDDMRLDSVHHYKKPASQERCVSCYVNPAAKLSLKGTNCVKSRNPCQYFCRHCLMNYHIHPLICPQHGKTRPPFGDRVYGVFVAGNNVENMQELSDGEDPSKVAQTFVRDAEKVVQILTSKHPFVLGANAGHLKIVKPNKPGTKEEMTRCIQNAFTEISRMIDEECKQTEYKPNNRLPDSLFIFYFTGHCSKEKGLYLGNAEETLKASTEWINEMLHQKLHVDQVLVILDCCHADSQNFVHTQGFHTNTEENSPNLVHEGNKVNILQLSSCDTHQKSSALCVGQNHGQGSHFTDFLCKGLLGLDSENMGKNDIIYCDACKRKQGKNKEMDIGLPCVMYHLRCDRDHAVTITALKDYIQGHMDLPASDTDGNKHMTLISSAHGEKPVFLTYYNQDKMHISIHLKGSRKPEMFCFRSLPESIAKLKIEIIKHIVDEKVDCEMLLFYQSYIKVASVKQNMDCAILFSDPSYIQTFSCQIAIYPKYGREKDVEMEDMVHLYEAWHSNFELEARIREHVNGLCNGPVKLNTINKSMIPEHEDLFSSDYLRITQNDVEISIEQKSEAESQIKEIITKSSSTQHREFRKFLREVLNIIQDIPTQILEKKQKEVLKFNLYDDFSVLVIDDMSFRNPV